MTPFQLRKLKHIINHSGVVAYPTESVYGLGCNPGDFHAVTRLLALKNRPLHKGLIILASSLTQLEGWIEKPSASLWHQVTKTWPGPYNWILPAHPSVPDWVSGGRNTIAVRVSKHPVVKTICDYLGHPLVSTSANLSGRSPQTTALGVYQQFSQQLPDIIVAGQSGGLPPCPITCALTQEIIRD